ncbi:MAG: immunoglobulin domain-containing protein [Bacteroidetes bacterium]|nr:immunoglobulin domain-containing protein [Bacteroidota bacterium]MBU1717581.1 immunoglobulin domain-containing protein [Bacteroidota bacterium]
MKKIASIIFASALCVTQANSQTYAVLIGDNVEINVTGHNGSIQWQESTDNLSWTDMPGLTDSVEAFVVTSSPTGEKFYRAKITNATICENSSWYSSVIKHRIISNTTQIEVGDWFHGGIVFYTDGAGNGLIAPRQDQANNNNWGCFATSIPGATSNTNGAANTSAIVAACAERPIAASICDDLILDGFSDWFLPAKDQLYYLHEQRLVVGGFGYVDYWSSTENSANKAWAQYFHFGDQYDIVKYNNYNVRCVRAFAPSTPTAFTSTDAIVTSQPEAVSISTQPITQNLCLGSDATFSVVASGTEPFSYSWKKDGVSLDTSSMLPPDTMLIQGFNSSTCPSGWQIEKITDPDLDGDITFVSSSIHPDISLPYEGTHYVHFNSYDCDYGDEYWLTDTIGFSTIGETDIAVSFFWFENNQSSGSSEGVTVRWSTDGSSWNNIEFFPRYNPVNGWKYKYCFLPPTAEGQSKVFISLKFYSQYGYDCNLDDLVILAPYSGDPSDNSLSLSSVGLSDEGTYTCEVTNLCRTIETSDAVLKVIDISVDVGQDVTFCNDTAYHLIAVGLTNHVAESGTLIYSWSPSTALSAANIANPTAQPTANTTYSLTLSDQIGCSATDEVALTSITPVSIVAQPVSYNICLNSNVVFTTNTMGTAPITYIWKKDGNIIGSATSNTFSIPGVQLSDEATYTCEASNYCRTLVSDGAVLKVIDLSADAGFDGRICNGQSNTLIAIGTTNHSAESGALTYSWLPTAGLNPTNTDTTTASPIVSTDYIVTVTDQIGCTETDTVTVTVGNVFQDEEICLVTVDTVAWKNKISWEKTAGVGTSTFYVYKEVAANVYNWIGSVPFDSASFLIDYSSVPESHGDKYKISVIDTCDAESEKSYYHKTMNLVISSFGSTMGLSWTEYEDESGLYIPAKYYIYRGTQPNSMSLLDSISSSFTSYNDNNVFDVYYYMVGVQKDPPCGSNSTRISFSNKKDNSSLVNLNAFAFCSDAKVFPNPFSDNCRIEFPNHSNSRYLLSIMDITGKVVKQFIVTGNEATFDREGMESGFYTFELKGDRLYKGKIVVQ